MKIFMLLILLGLTSCAADSQQQHFYDMSWSCGANSNCANHMGNWRGSGQFSNEQDCLVWETAFLNSYNNVYVTPCTYN